MFEKLHGKQITLIKGYNAQLICPLAMLEKRKTVVGNGKKTRASEICSKLTIKTPERRQ